MTVLHANLKTHVVVVTSDADGDAVTTIGPFRGYVVGVIYTKGDYEDTVDFTIATATTGIGVWTEANVTASKDVFPTLLEDDQVGGARATTRLIPLANEKLSITIAAAGDTKSGTFTLIYEGN